LENSTNPFAFERRGLLNEVILPKELRKIYADARSDANKKAKGFTLKLFDISQLWEDQRGKCKLCDRPFANEIFDAFVKQPRRPSLDRIDHTKGYEPANVRLTCIHCNMARGQWGDAAFIEMCLAVAEANKAGRGTTEAATSVGRDVGEGGPAAALGLIRVHSLLTHNRTDRCVPGKPVSSHRLPNRRVPRA